MSFILIRRVIERVLRLLSTTACNDLGLGQAANSLNALGVSLLRFASKVICAKLLILIA